VTRRITLLAVFAAGLLPAAGVKLPQTPAGKRFARFIEAFNSGEKARMVAFHKETANGVNAEERAAKDMEARRQSGGLTLYKVVKSEPYSIAVLAKTVNSGEWVRFEFDVSPDPPHDVIRIMMEPAEAPKEEAD